MTSNNKEEKSNENTKAKKHRMNGFEEWGGYMASKKMKLAAQFAGQRDTEIEDQETVRSDIFKGISIFVNGYTKPSADELRRLMLIHGGTYHHYYSTTKTTHTVASNLPYSKIKNLKNQIVVTPDWITDSIKAGKLLPHQNYLLCSLEMTHKQPRLQNFLESKEAKSSAKNYESCDKSNSDVLLQNTSKASCELLIDVPKSYTFQTDIASYPSSAVPSMSSVASVNNNNFQTDMSNYSSSATSFSSNNFQTDFANYSSFATTSMSTVTSVNNKTTSPSKNETPVTAGHPDFLSEFYSHSRLHHISTSGQELKRYVQNLVDNHSSDIFTGREHLKSMVKNGVIRTALTDPSICDIDSSYQKVVMHLDMDCFFVSVGLRNHPELRGKPVAVTHSKGKRGGVQEGSDVHYEAAHYANQSKKKLAGLTSDQCDIFDEEHGDVGEFAEKQKPSKYSKDYGSLSEIASCSYEARKAGVRNGMFLGEALRRCPNLKTIPYDFEGYSEVSKQLYDIVVSYTLDIEAVSCDELYIDCTELLQDTGVSPLQFASVLRTEIEQKTKCTASAGLGANMLIARLANRIAKPNGQHYVPNDQVEEFMLKQKVKDLPGVGYSTSIKFEQMGVISCGDLQKWNLSKLQQEFGPKTGQTLFKRCRGKDNRNVQLQKERKSVSAEINYGIRFEKEEEVFNFIKELSVEVVNRVRNINCKGKSITLKLMVRHADAPVQTAKFMGHGVCDHIAKSVSLKSATDDPVVIGQECCSLARSLKIKPADYRGVGIQLSKLEPIHKSTKGLKTIESFISGCANNSEIGTNAEKEIFAPKEIVQKSVPKINTIKDFMLNKPSVSKQQVQPQAFSVDQIDQSFLNALPEDLQKEVLEMCSTKSSTVPGISSQHSSTSTHPTPCTSKQSKSTAKKSHLAPQAKTKVPSKQNTILDCVPSIKNYSCEEDREEETIFKRKATIGGAENINEIRNLVKEWVLSSQVVLDEDIDQFRDFILQVIDEDLRKVDLILKYFHRVVSTANTLWQQAYLTILSYVQQKMLEKFGTMLEAKSDFST